jgi:hypothetical protein
MWSSDGNKKAKTLTTKRETKANKGVKIIGKYEKREAGSNFSFKKPKTQGSWFQSLSFWHAIIIGKPELDVFIYIYIIFYFNIYILNWILVFLYIYFNIIYIINRFKKIIFLKNGYRIGYKPGPGSGSGNQNLVPGFGQKPKNQTRLTPLKANIKESKCKEISVNNGRKKL